MATYPKITGNAASGSVTSAQAAKFDLLTLNSTYSSNVAISPTANLNILTKRFLHSSDGHTEVYCTLIIKNTSSTATNLRINQISLMKGSIQSGTLDGSVWSVGSAGSVSEDSNAPIELDYFKKNTNGTDSTTPFIGIQSETAGSGGTEDSGNGNQIEVGNSSFSAYATPPNFLKFKVVNRNGEGIVEYMAANTAEDDFDFRCPIYTAKSLTTDTTGIPAGRYATITFRVSVDSVAAFNNDTYSLVIKHDGVNGGFLNQDVSIPITLEMTNNMSIVLRLDDATVQTGAGSTTASTVLSGVLNTFPTVPTTTDSNTSNFASAAAAEDYIAGVGQIDLDLTRQLFRGNTFSWNDISPVGENVSLNIEITNNVLTTLASDQLQETIFEGIADLGASVRSKSFKLATSPLGTATSNVSPQNYNALYGVHENFDFASQNQANKIQFIANTPNPNAETIQSTIGIIIVKHSLFTVPDITVNKMVNLNNNQGAIAGVNHTKPNWNVSDNLTTESIIHTTATGDFNTEFLHIYGTGKQTTHQCAPGYLSNYFDRNGNFSEYSSITALSEFDINVRINVTQSSDDLVFNGITTWTAVSDNITNIKKGLGFAKSNCSVHMTAYASNPETIESLTYGNDASHTGGDGNNDSVTSAISGISAKRKDYSVKLETSNPSFASSPRGYNLTDINGNFDTDTYNYIQGLGAETYTAQISLPTGHIDYGLGRVPNHTTHSRTASFNVAKYPVLPDLGIVLFQTNLGNTYISSGGNYNNGEYDANAIVDPIAVDKWQKLNVTANADIGQVASTRTNPTDGLYDWNQNALADGGAVDTAARGLYRMPSTNKVDFNASSNEVFLDLHLVVNASSIGSDNFIVSDEAKFSAIQVGMLLIKCPKADGSSALPTQGLVVKRKDDSNNKVFLKGANNQDVDLVTPASSADLVLLDDWIQPGMVVESDNLPTDRIITIQKILANTTGSSNNANYTNSDNIGGNYEALRADSFVENKAVSIFLIDADTNAEVNPLATLAFNAGSAVGFSVVKKPYHTFSQMTNVGLNTKYEIQNQSLANTYPGEKVRIVGGSQHSSNGSSDNTIGVEYTVSGTAGVHPLAGQTSSIQNSNVVDIIVDSPTEYGVRLSNGSLLNSRKNPGRLGANNYSTSYADINPIDCNLLKLTLDGSDISGTIYKKDFFIKLSNGGEEHLFLKSYKFIDATHTEYQASTGSIYSSSPSASTGVSWKVGLWGLSAPTLDDVEDAGGTGLAGNAASSLDVYHPSSQGNTGSTNLNGYEFRIPKPQENEGDVTLSDVSQPVSKFNAIPCRFQVNTANANGTYYKFLQIEYYRNTGRSEFFKNSSGVIESRPFKNKEVWFATIPIAVNINSIATIQVTDADTTEVNQTPGESLVIDGLIG